MSEYSLERSILEGIFGEIEIHSMADYWYFYAYSPVQFESRLGEIKAHPELTLLETRDLDTAYVIEFRFTQPPRIVYGEPDAEIARLRAAGRALADEAVQWDDHSQGWRCIGCGAFHDVFEQVVHAEHCRVLVFKAKEGGNE
jgi:hypothetical protein